MQVLTVNCFETAFIQVSSSLYYSLLLALVFTIKHHKT